MFKVSVIKDLRKTFLKEPQYTLKEPEYTLKEPQYTMVKRNKYLQRVRYLLREKLIYMYPAFNL